MEHVEDEHWRKASYSGSNGGGCVEVGQAAGTVLVRDTTNREGAELRFNVAAWHELTEAIKHQ